jgi:hypothetical protein
VAERTTLAAVMAVLGVFIILVGLGYVRLPAPGEEEAGAGPLPPLQPPAPLPRQLHRLWRRQHSA